MWLLNDWHDFLRVGVFFLSVFCLYVLLKRKIHNDNKWNTKTKDYWYALLMWCVSGAVLSIQGIVLDRPFTPGQVFVTAAVLVTGKGLRRKGDWGGSD